MPRGWFKNLAQQPGQDAEMQRRHHLCLAKSCGFLLTLKAAHLSLRNSKPHIFWRKGAELVPLSVWAFAPWPRPAAEPSAGAALSRLPGGVRSGCSAPLSLSAWHWGGFWQRCELLKASSERMCSPRRREATLGLRDSPLSVYLRNSGRKATENREATFAPVGRFAGQTK